AVGPHRPVGKAAPISVELPLFVQRPHTAAQETEAPVVPPAPPPLSVRRRTPDAARIQATYQRETAPAPSPAVRKAGPVDRDLLEDLNRLDAVSPSPSSSESPSASRTVAANTDIDAGDHVAAAKRAAAAGL